MLKELFTYSVLRIHVGTCLCPLPLKYVEIGCLNGHKDLLEAGRQPRFSQCTWVSYFNETPTSLPSWLFILVPVRRGASPRESPIPLDLRRLSLKSKKDYPLKRLSHPKQARTTKNKSLKQKETPIRCLRLSPTILNAVSPHLHRDPHC